MVRVGGFEPGTIALGVLSGVAGVSGYGANVVNRDQQKVVDEKVATQVATMNASVEELNAVKESLAVETSEKEKLQSEVESLKSMIEELKREKAVPEPIPEPEDNSRAEPTDEKEQRDSECKAVLDGVGITSRRQFLKWSKMNHPDKGGDTAIYQRVNECVLRLYPQGGLRKKKLRTRRGGKQNVGRSRSRKDGPDRTH